MRWSAWAPRRMASFPELDEYGLGAWAFKNAIDDCGLDKNLVDGLGVCRVPSYTRMGEVLGLNPRWTLTLPAHGRMSGISIVEGGGSAQCGADRLRRADLYQYRTLQACQLRWRRKPQHLESVGLHLAGRRPCADVPTPCATVWHHGARPGGSGDGLSPPRLPEPRRRDEDPHHDRRPRKFAAHRRAAAPVGLLPDQRRRGLPDPEASTERARGPKRPPVRISGIGARETYVESSLPNFSSDFWYDALQDTAAEVYGMAGIGPRMWMP